VLARALPCWPGRRRWINCSAAFAAGWPPSLLLHLHVDAFCSPAYPLACLPACLQVVGKPQASFFQLALAGMGCSPGDAVMIAVWLGGGRAGRCRPGACSGISSVTWLRAGNS
jgi:hypothetical protein